MYFAGKSSSSVLSVVRPPMPLSKLSASMRPIDASVTPASSLRPIDASLPPASSAPMPTTSMASSISTNQGSGNNTSSGYSMGSRITSGFSQVHSISFLIFLKNFLEGVFKARVDLCLTCSVAFVHWIPQIHLWCDTR